jgi:DNA-binding response OmpR family regulator
MPNPFAAEVAAQRILVVDDDALLRRALVRTLEQASFTVAAAADGQAALDLAQQYDYDLVLTDIQMPHMTGIELVRGLQREQRFMPVVMMSGGNFDRDRLLHLGAVDILSKPFDMAEMLAVLRSMLERPAPSALTPRPALARARRSP